MNMMRTLWNYVKINDLQDKVDRRAVRADDNLAPWVLRWTGFLSYELVGQDIRFR